MKHCQKATAGALVVCLLPEYNRALLVTVAQPRSKVLVLPNLSSTWLRYRNTSFDFVRHATY